MRETLQAKKGFSLIEILVSLGISFLLLLIIYKAYFLSTTFFQMGIATIQEQTYLRKIFSVMDADFRYLNRFNSINTELDTVEFENFNASILEVKDNNDKQMEGNVITYSTTASKDINGTDYLIITKTTDVYDWLMKFGHDQTPNDKLTPPGYPEDMLDPVTGKSVTGSGEPKEIIDQDENMPFIITAIKYIPYDSEGIAIESIDGFEYSVLKTARSIRVEIEYLMKSEYGDASGSVGRKKTASTNISFISLAENKTEIK